MLETYDPDWQAKWDRAHAMMRELEVRDWSSLTADDRHRLDKLRRLLPVAFDASHRTANEYIDLHLSLTLKEADRLGIWAWLPRLPDSADIDTTRAAVRKVYAYVEAVKRERSLREVCRRAGVRPIYGPVRARSMPTWRERLAMLRWRVSKLFPTPLRP